MPAIFTQENKDELYRGMIEAGWDLLAREGVRSLRVECVAQAVGIAKGTFYSFFPSKGAFVYALLMENRQRAVDTLEQVRQERGGARVGRAEVRAWLEEMWCTNRNIFRIATADDYACLVKSLPSEQCFDPAADDRLIRWLVDEAAAMRPGVDVHAVLNLQMALAFTLLNRRFLHADALEKTVSALIEATLDELFGKESVPAE